MFCIIPVLICSASLEYNNNNNNNNIIIIINNNTRPCNTNTACVERTNRIDTSSNRGNWNEPKIIQNMYNTSGEHNIKALSKEPHCVLGKYFGQ
jgi:tRNA-dihydrouridine synthase